MSRKFLSPAVASAALLIGSGSAHAAAIYTITESSLGSSVGNPAQPTYEETITSGTGGTSDTFDVNWNASTGSGGKVVAASASIQVTTFTTSELDLKVTITNNATFPADAAITDFGLYVNPSVSSVSGTGGTYFTSFSTGNTPGFNTVDVCAYTGNNCSGGSVMSGLPISKTDTFTIQLTGGNFGPDANSLSATIAEFSTKWQGGSPLSYEIPGVPGDGIPTTTTTNPPPQVPEPTTLAILGAGLAGLGAFRRRR